MPKKPYHERVAENLRALQEGKEPPHADAADEARKQKNDLDSAARQTEIMNPEGTCVKLSFGELRLYPFTLDNQAGADGFVKGVLADAMGAGVRNTQELALRVPSALLRNARNRLELLEYVAVASQPPGKLTENEKIAPVVEDLRGKLAPDDYVKLFNEVSERARVVRDPKP